MDRVSRPVVTLRIGLVLACIGLVSFACNRASNPPAASQPSTTSASSEATTATPAPAGKNPTDEPSPVAQSPASESQKAPGEAQTSDSSTSETKAPHREPLFVNWPKPQFVLLVTGQQMGYIEPCGCTGLVNQKGGLSRRHTLAKQLAERGWQVVPLDVGNQVLRFGRQSELKFQLTSDAFKKIGYKGVALGADDLRLPAADLLAQTSAADGAFLSANAALFDVSLTPTYRIVEVDGKKIGVTSVISEEWQKKIMGGDVLLKSSSAGLDEVLPKLRDAKCDVLVLLAQASLEESQQFAKKYKDFRIIVTAGGGSEPTFQPEPIPETDAILVRVGLKGMFAGVLGFFDDAKQPIRYQRVPLDARFEDSSDMLALMASYQEQLKSGGFEGLGIKAVPHTSGLKFVGTEKCGECHKKAFDVWKGSKHAHATESLVHPPERGEIARHYDPECLSCHVTGWNPQQFFPYESGYLDLDKTPLMKGSGCENCHGPGSAHVAAEEGDGNPTPDMLKTLRAAMRLPLAQAEKKCQECHDADNSPDFHDVGAFEKYWKQVEHKGLD